MFDRCFPRLNYRVGQKSRTFANSFLRGLPDVFEELEDPDQSLTLQPHLLWRADLAHRAAAHLRVPTSLGIAASSNVRRRFRHPSLETHAHCGRSHRRQDTICDRRFSTQSIGAQLRRIRTPNNTKRRKFKHEIGDGSFTKSKAPEHSEAQYLRPPAELVNAILASATGSVNLSIQDSGITVTSFSKLAPNRFLGAGRRL